MYLLRTYSWYISSMYICVRCVHRRVYQCLSGMKRVMEPSELGKNIIFGHLGRFKTAQGLPLVPHLTINIRWQSHMHIFYLTCLLLKSMRFKCTNCILLSESDCPPLAEMEKKYPKLTHLWNYSDQESLNASQREALKKAYHGMFHIIQGPPGM